jgi:hypothetical protein
LEDVHSLTLADGDNVRLQAEPYVVIEVPETFRRWCIQNGLENKLTLPWQSANNLTKERLLAGEPEPDGTKAYMLTKVVFTREG